MSLAAGVSWCRHALFKTFTNHYLHHTLDSTPHFFNLLQNLSEEIDTEASKFLVRAGTVSVILKKVEEKSWTDLRKKSDS
jgi:hypothetical protein